MITMPTQKFTPESNLDGNASDTMTDAVTDMMDLGSTNPTSQVSVCLIMFNFQVDNSVGVQDFAQVGADSTLPSV